MAMMLAFGRNAGFEVMDGQRRGTQVLVDGQNNFIYHKSGAG
jgi:hypothetical protein